MSWFSKHKVFRVAGSLIVSASSVAWVASSNTVKNESESGPDGGFANYALRLKPTTVWDSNWDKREQSSIGKSAEEKLKEVNLKVPEQKTKANRHLLLIRHGQYHTAEETDDKMILSDLGRVQADLTGHRLKALGLPYMHILHSPMTRARQTADIIHKHLPAVTMQECDLIQEGAPYPPEPPSDLWKPEPKEFITDGARIEAAFKKYFHRALPEQQTDSYEVMVCHANVIRYFVCRALQLPPEAWLRMTLNHASVTWITIRPNGRVTLRSLGDAGFMPPERLSHL